MDPFSPEIPSRDGISGSAALHYVLISHFELNNANFAPKWKPYSNRCGFAVYTTDETASF